jgi:hypothetical protein
MSRIWDYLKQACEGLQQYLSQNNLVVILVAVLLFFWLSEKKETDQKTNRLLVYTFIMVLILICPLSAMAVMIYQTSFYEYAWAWSLVPFTIVCAYGIASFWGKIKAGWQKIGIIGVSVVILCLVGNQGMVQRASTQEVASRRETQDILQEIHSFYGENECIVWAPKRIMQEIRRYDGQVLLLYGKDMWDQKSGAYDYEAYSQEMTDAYLWLEEVMDYYDLALSVETPEETMRFLDQQYEWSIYGKSHIANMMNAGTNTIVLPELVSGFLEADIECIVEEHGKSLKKTGRAGYVIWVIG